MQSRPAEPDAKAARAEELSRIVVGEGLRIHRALGPGLLESVYEAVLAQALQRRGLRTARQRPVAFEFDGLFFEDGLRPDLLVENVLVVEIKSVETIAPVHIQQVLTYLRLLDLSLGLLINFSAATFVEGCRRVVDRHPRVPQSSVRIAR
jgi:iron complex transport system substrate-binding protein